MSPETAKFIPKFIEAVEAGHIKFFIEESPRCDNIACSKCAFYCMCEDFTDAIDQGTYTQRWNTAYYQFIQPYINYKESSIKTFKLKYPELFI